MKKKEPKFPPSEISAEEAKWMQEVDELTTRRMVEWLKAGVDVRLPIDNLKPPHFAALAEIARATYAVAWSERLAQRRDVVADTQLDWLI